MDSVFIGAHTVANGGIHMAAIRAGNAGMKALQIFTAPPQYYGDKASVRPERVQRFHGGLAAAKIAPEHVVVHAAYVLNSASEDETKSARARAGLRKELERSTALGVGSVCFHPGAATSGDRMAAADRVGKAIADALDAVAGATRLLVENTAGAGLTLGKTAEEVARDPPCRAGPAPRANRLWSRYLSPLCLGPRHQPLRGGTSPESSTSSRKPPAHHRPSFT